MKLVKIAEDEIRGALEDTYELQASAGEDALPDPLPLDHIFDMPSFKTAARQIAAGRISLVASGSEKVLRLQALQRLNTYTHSTGDAVEIGALN